MMLHENSKRVDLDNVLTIAKQKVRNPTLLTPLQNIFHVSNEFYAENVRPNCKL